MEGWPDGHHHHHHVRVVRAVLASISDSNWSVCLLVGRPGVLLFYLLYITLVLTVRTSRCLTSLLYVSSSSLYPGTPLRNLISVPTVPNSCLFRICPLFCTETSVSPEPQKMSNVYFFFPLLMLSDVSCNVHVHGSCLLNHYFSRT